MPLMMKKTFMFLLASLSAALFSTAALAENPVTEIFAKGSIDGKKLFLVLGFENSTEIFKSSMKNAIDIDDLQDIGSKVYNSNHHSDIIGYAGAGARFTERAARKSLDFGGKAFTSPWRSLKKIPQSYAYSMGNAVNSMYSNSNPVLGAMGFAGHAVWANVKGAYYLVVEAPVKAAAYTTGSVGSAAAAALAVPTMVTLRVAGIALSLTWEAVETVGTVLGGAATMAYSAISTTAAATGAVVAGAAVAVFNGGKWLVTAPFNLGKAVKVKQDTGLSMHKIEDLSAAIETSMPSELIESLGLSGQAVVEKQGRYSSKLVFMDSNEEREALVVEVKVRGGKLEARSHVTKDHFKALQAQSDVGEDELKENVKEAIETSLAQVAETL